MFVTKIRAGDLNLSHHWQSSSGPPMAPFNSYLNSFNRMFFQAHSKRLLHFWREKQGCGNKTTQWNFNKRESYFLREIKKSCSYFRGKNLSFDIFSPLVGKMARTATSSFRILTRFIAFEKVPLSRVVWDAFDRIGFVVEMLMLARNVVLMCPGKAHDRKIRHRCRT